MKQPKPISRKYKEIIDNINEGIYQIPKFQRNFVWNKEQTAKLVDSLIKAYPIGTFILWKTQERLKSLKKIGGKILKYPEENDYVYYILDGQQRITSIYLAIEGIKIDNENYKELYINLDKELDINEDICLVDKPENYLTFYEAINSSLLDLSEKYGKEAARKIEQLRSRIKEYEFATIEIEHKKLEEIAEVFTRINTGGKRLTLFEIMNAKVYSEKKVDDEGNILIENFDLEEEFNHLIEELKYSSYETIADNKTVILQLISAILKENTKREAILSIKKEDFIAEWSKTVDSLKLAIDLIRTHFRIPVSKLLPYYALTIPIAYFYRNNRFNEPTTKQLELITKYFFRATFSWRYSSSTESKLNKDIKLMKDIIANETINIKERIKMDNETREYFIERLREKFSTSNAFDKGVLSILAYKEPKRFDNNSLVTLDNSWLKISRSKNYHHFFPKAFLKKINNNEFANSLANITFIDDYLNKRKIKAKSPSVYIGEFMDENNEIKKSLKTHLIDDIKDYGILDDDYDKFLEKRSERIADEILSRI